MKTSQQRNNRHLQTQKTCTNQDVKADFSSNRQIGKNQQKFINQPTRVNGKNQKQFTSIQSLYSFKYEIIFQVKKRHDILNVVSSSILKGTFLGCCTRIAQPPKRFLYLCFVIRGKYKTRNWLLRKNVSPVKFVPKYYKQCNLTQFLATTSKWPIKHYSACVRNLVNKMQSG